MVSPRSWSTSWRILTLSGQSRQAEGDKNFSVNFFYVATTVFVSKSKDPYRFRPSFWKLKLTGKN